MNHSQVSDPLGWSSSPFLTTAPADHQVNLASAAATRRACCRYHQQMWKFMLFGGSTACQPNPQPRLSLVELSILAGLIPGRS